MKPHPHETQNGIDEEREGSQSPEYRSRANGVADASFALVRREVLARVGPAGSGAWHGLPYEYAWLLLPADASDVPQGWQMVGPRVNPTAFKKLERPGAIVARLAVAKAEPPEAIEIFAFVLLTANAPSAPSVVRAELEKHGIRAQTMFADVLTVIIPVGKLPALLSLEWVRSVGIGTAIRR